MSSDDSDIEYLKTVQDTDLKDVHTDDLVGIVWMYSGVSQVPYSAYSKCIQTSANSIEL